jgi:hypothetical protein
VIKTFKSCLFFAVFSHEEAMTAIDIILLSICVAVLLFRRKMLNKPFLLGWIALGTLMAVRIIRDLTHARLSVAVLILETVLFVIGIGGLIWGQRQDTEGVSDRWWVYGGVGVGLLGAIAAASFVLFK